MPPEQEPVIVLPEKFEDAWHGEDDILRRRKRLHLCSRAAAKARRDGHGSGWIQLRTQTGKLLAWINLDAYGAEEKETEGEVKCPTPDRPAATGRCGANSP